LTDEFATKAGYESVADMREKVAAEMLERTKATSDGMAEQNVMDKLLEVCTFELPKSLIESSANEYFNHEVNRLRTNHVPGSEIEAHEEEIRAEARANAIDEIKKFVALREVGDAEGIVVSEEDMMKEAEMISQSTGTEIDTVTQYLAQSDKRDSYTDRIFRRKAMAVLLGNAKITEKELPREPEEKKDE
jgi:trigger factor